MQLRSINAPPAQPVWVTTRASLLTTPPPDQQGDSVRSGLLLLTDFRVGELWLPEGQGAPVLPLCWLPVPKLQSVSHSRPPARPAQSCGLGGCGWGRTLPNVKGMQERCLLTMQPEVSKYFLSPEPFSVTTATLAPSCSLCEVNPKTRVPQELATPWF